MPSFSLLGSLDGEATAGSCRCDSRWGRCYCQITSRQVRDLYAVGITDMDFSEGTLQKPGNVRQNRLFSASDNLILYRAGHLNDQTVTSVVNRIIEILQAT